MDNKEEGKLEQALFLIKPDGLHKSLTGNILTSLSETGMKIVGAKVLIVPRELAEQHYNKLKEEKGDEIFEEVLKYIQGEFHTDRVFAFVCEGTDVIAKIRKVAGDTNPEKANPTTIRGKYGRIHSETKVFENVVHASDSEENAEREIKLWFKPHELTHTIYPTKEVQVENKELDWE